MIVVIWYSGYTGVAVEHFCSALAENKFQLVLHNYCVHALILKHRMSLALHSFQVPQSSRHKRWVSFIFQKFKCRLHCALLDKQLIKHSFFLVISFLNFYSFQNFGQYCILAITDLTFVVMYFFLTENKVFLKLNMH